MSLVVRPATPQDADAFPRIERAAAELFRSVAGLAWIADRAPAPAAAYLPFIGAGTVWVAEATGPVGFLAAAVEASELHILELDVLPAHQRRGIGRSLVEAAASKALELGLGALTLTTFRGVAWNEPLYGRLGFETVDGDQLCDRLRGYLAREAEKGLPPRQRCAMRRRLDRG